MTKRLIFVFLYADGYFHLSRNFRLQAVGTATWIKQHFDPSALADSVDEFMFLHVARTPQNQDSDAFLRVVLALTDQVYLPVTVGGNIRSVSDARAAFRAGADKILVNTLLWTNPSLVTSLSDEFGTQALVGSLDLHRDHHDRVTAYIECGQRPVEAPAPDLIPQLVSLGVGEVFINSIERDGTGQGLDTQILDELGKIGQVPIIVGGGAGKPEHLIEALGDARVEAVATAHLLNFVGDGLRLARHAIVDAGLDVAARD